MARIRDDYVFGTLGAALGTGDTTLTSTGLENLAAVTSPDVAAVTIHDGTNYEIVHVTAHTAASGTATILRGQEGTAAQAWDAGVEWEHGPTVLDLTISRNVCVATNTAGTNVPTATATTMPLAVEEYDSSGMHDTVTNNSRVTIPTGGAGVYTITATVAFAFNSSGLRAVQLFKNGTQITSSANGTPAASGSVHVPTTLLLSAGDYLEVKAYQDSGSTLSTTARLAVFQVA